MSNDAVGAPDSSTVTGEQGAPARASGAATEPAAVTAESGVPAPAPAVPKAARQSSAAKPAARKISAALQRAVQGAGEAWAVDSANALRDEGRQVTGGWPGTISEARQRVRTCALLQGVCMTSEDLEVLTRVAYETAKKVWLARSERVSDD